MRLSDAGVHQRQTNALDLNHRPPPWPNEDATRDRSNRLLDDTTGHGHTYQQSELIKVLGNNNDCL